MHKDLWYDGKISANIVQSNLIEFNVVNIDAPACCFDDAEQRQCQGRLPGPRSTHNPNLQ